MKKETYNVIEYGELEDLLIDNFDWLPNDYNYPDENNRYNGSYEIHDLEKSNLSLEERNAKIDDSRGNDKKYIYIPALLDELCDRNLLPEGKLLILISW